MTLYQGHEPLTAFRCPACHEYLVSTATRCRYCGVDIDPGYASDEVRREELANRHYRKGHYSKHLRRGGAIFLLGLVALIGSYFLFPILLHSDAVWIPRGLLLGGGGDFIYGVWGLTGEARNK